MIIYRIGLNNLLLFFSFSVMSNSLRPVDYSMPGFPVLHHLKSLLKLISTESVVPSKHLILCFLILLLPQSFPESGLFSMSQLFASGSQSTGVSASVLPMNIQDSFPLGWIGLILQSKGLSRVFFKNHSLKASILWCSAFFMVQLSQVIHI